MLIQKLPSVAFHIIVNECDCSLNDKYDLSNGLDFEVLIVGYCKSYSNSTSVIE